MATKVKASENETVNRVADVIDTPPTMKPKILTFKIIGISPLLHNNPAAFIGKTGGDEGLVTKKEYNDEEEARLRVYKDADGHFVHPAESFIKSMVRAVTGRKFGKKAAPAVIKGAVFLAEQFCIIENDDGKPVKEYTIDRRSVVINKKSRVLRCRPCFQKWSMSLALDVDTALVGREQLLDALSLAGRTIGVGDYRPEKGGGFGRFRCE